MKNEVGQTKKAILYALDKHKYQKQFNAFHYFILGFGTSA